MHGRAVAVRANTLGLDRADLQCADETRKGMAAPASKAVQDIKGVMRSVVGVPHSSPRRVRCGVSSAYAEHPLVAPASRSRSRPGRGMSARKNGVPRVVVESFRSGRVQGHPQEH